MKVDTYTNSNMLNFIVTIIFPFLDKKYLSTTSIYLSVFLPVSLYRYINIIYIHIYMNNIYIYMYIYTYIYIYKLRFFQMLLGVLLQLCCSRFGLKHQWFPEIDQMLKNDHIQCIICCSNWKYTNTLLITAETNTNRTVNYCP